MPIKYLLYTPLFFSSLLISGCLMNVKIGAHPQLDNLPSLQVGVSNSADVLLAMGEPRGSGMTKISAELEARKIWFYEFMKSDGEKTELEILLIFMLDDMYDGHLWFSSFIKYEIEGVLPSIFGVEELRGGNFPSTRPLEEKFRRGISTEEEVIIELGTPTGTGTAIMPPDHLSMDVIYYEYLELLNIESRGRGTQTGTYIVADSDQRILLVFLDEGRFDGFMWFTNDVPAEGLVR